MDKLIRQLMDQPCSGDIPGKAIELLHQPRAVKTGGAT